MGGFAFFREVTSFLRRLVEERRIGCRGDVEKRIWEFSCQLGTGKFQWMLGHNNNWDAVHCRDSAEACRCLQQRDRCLQHQGTFPNTGDKLPRHGSRVTETDSVTRRDNVPVTRCRWCCPLFARPHGTRQRVMSPWFTMPAWQPPLAQYLEALSRCHGFFTVMISAPRIITPQLRCNLYRILGNESKSCGMLLKCSSSCCSFNITFSLQIIFPILGALAPLTLWYAWRKKSL